MILLEDPDLVHATSYRAFLAAIWFYMTPQAPKPSIHDVASGFFVPTQSDLDKHLVFGFGFSTNIINGGYECGQGSETGKSQQRINAFKEFLEYFGLPEEDEESMGCRKQPTGDGLPTGDNYGMTPSYFEVDKEAGHCVPSIWQSAYHVGTQDDYRRCMCRHFPTDPNNVGADCPKET
jgi:hypothetical protein